VAKFVQEFVLGPARPPACSAFLAANVIILSSKGSKMNIRSASKRVASRFWISKDPPQRSRASGAFFVGERVATERLGEDRIPFLLMI
jgi:hypothetical protein